MIDKLDCIGLIIFLVHLETSDMDRIVDGGALESAGSFSLLSSECQKPDVHLDAVTGNLFVIALGMDCA